MKAYWLVAVLLIQIIPLSLQKEGEDGEDDPAKLISDFVKVAVDQLHKDSNLGETVKDVLGDLREAFSSDKYRGTFIPAIVEMLDKFVNNEYYVSAATLAKIMKSVLHESTREPDGFRNNMSRVYHRSIKTVGETVKNVAGVGSAAVRVVKDLYNKQKEYTNAVFDKIPYLGTVLQKVNNAISKVLGTIHMIVKVGIKGAGTLLSDYAEKKRQRLKQKVSEEKRAKQEAAESDEDEGEGTDESAEGDEENKPKQPPQKGKKPPPKKKNKESVKKGQKDGKGSEKKDGK